MCDATLQLIGEVSSEWGQKLLAEKFRFHNAQVGGQVVRMSSQNKGGFMYGNTNNTH